MCPWEGLPGFYRAPFRASEGELCFTMGMLTITLALNSSIPGISLSYPAWLHRAESKERAIFSLTCFHLDSKQERLLRRTGNRAPAISSTLPLLSTLPSFQAVKNGYMIGKINERD